MRKLIFILIFIWLAVCQLFSQQAIQLGAGSYAEYPPESVWDEDGYFAKNYRWFKDNWQHLYLHPDTRQKPLPTNKWWTNYVFSQYGGNAWAYPHAVSADNEGIDIKISTAFQSGNMVITPFLEIKASSTLQIHEEAIIFADFESTNYPTGWTVSANPPFTGPVSLADITQSPTPSGFTGNRFVNSFKGNQATFTLISTPFVISKSYIRLRVGGGNYINDTYVGLFIDGVRIFAETGTNSGTLTQRTWDVNAYIGQTAEIRIVDNSSAGWGFIMCDEIVFSNSTFSGTGYPNDFSPRNSNVYDWTDLGFTFRNEDNNGRYMDVTLVHGIPFTWIELNNLVPILKPGTSANVFDKEGSILTEFPISTDAFTIEFSNRIYGVHVPTGSMLHKSAGGDFQVEIPESAPQYLVVSTLPERSFLSLYDEYARNKPTNTTFEWDYPVTEGKITTAFVINTSNLQNQETGGSTIMSFLPHHYRNTQTNFSFIPGADYQIIRGKMQTAVGNDFRIDYPFGGMPPYLPEPTNLSGTQKTRINSMLTSRTSASGGFNGNTYAKGLGEKSNMMLMAKEMNHPGFETMKTNLKNELTDWMTFNPDETTKKQYFFAKYPDYGAIIGFPPGYGSQGFNDLHFHYGYFTMGAARLMMVDNEFKRDFAEMTKLITRSFANWKRYPSGIDYLPFLRTFDPYVGHSWAGGTGDGGGNNQESSSEAIHSWFGVYLLGLELNDPEIIKLGAMGYVLETTATAEYWLDLYDENFPTTYTRDYVGILRTDNIAWATYFSGDPAWILGIQAVPCDFFYHYMGKVPGKMKSIWESMIVDRTNQMFDPDGDGPLGPQPLANTTDALENILSMNSYLGGYQINMINTFDPVRGAQLVDSLYDRGGSWATDVNSTTNYYLSNAIITYGTPAAGYHTSIPSGAVYQNLNGDITYLLYNPTDNEIDVDIYKDNSIIETIRVSARKYYNSKFSDGHNPTVSFTSHKEGAKFALNKKVKIQVNASDKDGYVQQVDFYVGEYHLGTSLTAPFAVNWSPSTSGMKYLIAIATDNDGNKSDSCKIQVEVLTIEQTPYINRPWRIPADKILAVQFDHGGSGISCQDNEIAILGGNNLRADTGVETENSNNGDGNIGYTNAGEWFEYTVEVENPGVYALSLRMSSAYGGAIHVAFDGDNKTGSMTINRTGSWGTYIDTIVAHIPLKAGMQIMRVTIDKAGINLSSCKFTKTDLPMPTLINEIKQDLSVSVYPLPFEDVLMIKTLSQNGIKKIMIHSVSGELLLNKELENLTQFEINTSALCSGYYILTLLSDDQVISKKIIK